MRISRVMIWTMGALILLPIGVPTALASDASDFSRALDSYAATVALPPRVSFRSNELREEKLLQRGANAEHAEGALKNGETADVFRRDGDRFDVIQHSTGRIVWIRGMDLVADEPRMENSRVVIADDSHLAEFINGSGAYVLPNREKAMLRVAARLGFGRVLEGYLPSNGGHSIADLLKGGTSQTIEQLPARADGLQTLTLSANTAYGHVVLRVDPEHAFLPREITVQKNGADKMYDRPVAQLGIAEDVTMADSFDAEQVDGKWVMVGMQLKETLRSAKGEIRETAVLYHRSDVELNPKFPADAFVLAIPEGTPACVLEDHSGSRFEWHGGKAAMVVPGVGRTLDGAVKRGESFPGSALRTSGWTFVFGVVIFAGAIAVIYLLLRGKRDRRCGH